MTRTNLRHPSVRRRRALLIRGIATGVVLALGATSHAAELDRSARDRAIDGVLQAVLDGYVYPETAEEMDAAVRARRDAGEYDEVTSGAVLAELLTEHLRDVCHDRHLRVRYSSQPIPERDPSGPTPADLEQRALENARSNHGFVRVERLPGNIGYVKLDGFFNATPAARATATAAMNFVAHCDALIFDLRENGGGDPEMVAWISSYLFGDDPVHLNSLYFRPADETTAFWTDPEVPGLKAPDADVFVLTSHYTFSAAEEFTYNLQCLERATIVGETTGGGAHPGGTQRVDDHFSIWLPTGRAINPITGTNWEGTGVAPDVESPADEALAQARIVVIERRMPDADAEERAELRDALRAAHRDLADIEIAKEEAEG